MTLSPLIERFIRYARIETTSSDTTGTSPSTACQHDLARLLAQELRDMGASDVLYDDVHCYVYAQIPGEGQPLGFIAHMDTSPAASGRNVSPRILPAYDGTDALLRPEDFPELRSHFGEDLIASDGTTLLGADDKAGVAEIMEMARYYLEHPEVPHRALSICFTPDEEVGQGTDHFDPDAFRAREAYTVDGGKLGVFEYECFNAAAAEVSVQGRSVHPGSAKGLMKNAATLAMEFDRLLPAAERPEYTEGREGFFMLTEIRGETDTAHLSYIVRDHDRDRFEARKETLRRVANYMNEEHGEGTISLTITDSYRNMAEYMRDHMDLVDKAFEAARAIGVTPSCEPVRGGTDGARLAEVYGIPCPNLCTGGYNFHGRYEYASIQEMEKSLQILLHIAQAC